MTASNWYWLNGTPYCPGCVECDDPALSPENIATATRGPASSGWCACCHATAADRTQSLYREAESRVRGDGRLAQHAATILDDHGDGDDHWRWVIDADADEILGWARRHG